MSSSSLADVWAAEMRGLAELRLRDLAIHVVDARSFDYYTRVRLELETKYGPLDAPWPEPPSCTSLLNDGGET